MNTAIVPRQDRTPIRHPINQSCLSLLKMFLHDKEIRGLTRSTREKYAKTCKEFLLFTSGLSVSEIRPRDIRDYLAFRVKLGASTRTLQAQLSALRSMFDFAEAMSIVLVSPARTIRQRRYSRKIPRVLTQEEVDRLIDSQDNIRDKALLELMYATGCRVQEVALMRVRDVNWSARTIIVFGKGSKERLVPLNTRSVDLLRQYLGNRTAGWLFQADGQRNQHGKVVRRPREGSWIGEWRHSYEFDSDGKLHWHTHRVTLGRIGEISREYAKKRFARVRPSLDPRPRPVKDYPLDTTSLRYIIRKAAYKAGIPHFHPHMLRHTFATHLYEGGADILTVSKFLGHVSISTTQIYTRVSTRRLQEAIEKFHPHWR